MLEHRAGQGFFHGFSLRVWRTSVRRMGAIFCMMWTRTYLSGVREPSESMVGSAAAMAFTVA